MALPSGMQQYQDFYDFMNSGAFNWWSDGSKSAFFNYMQSQNDNQHEIDMWNMQNEYNSPEKQMERMVAAGINPAAAYNQISSGNASSVPQTHTPTYQFNDQQQRFQRINTILSGINSVLSSVGQVVQSASGIQGMGLNYQKNYLTLMRNDALRNSAIGFYNSEELNSWGADKSKLIRIGEDAWIDPWQAVYFPELVGAGKLNQSFDVLDMNKNNSWYLNKIREKNLNVDKSMESLIDSLTQGNWKQALQESIRLILINLFRRY